MLPLNNCLSVCFLSVICPSEFDQSIFICLYWKPIIGDYFSVCMVIPAIVCDICLVYVNSVV